MGGRSFYSDWGFEHESNGESEPASRSWDRVYVKFYFENKRMRLSHKLWSVVDTDEYSELHSERTSTMEEFLGYQSLDIGMQLGGTIIKAYGRYNPNSHHSYTQAMLLWPLNKEVLWGLVYSNGYGDSLRSYNLEHESYGVGLLLNP